MQASDLNPNPGPYKPKFPCAICKKAARWDQRATCCNHCNNWYHVDCMGMSTFAYNALQISQVSWICCQCGIPNFASSLFSNSSIEQANSFSILSDLSTSDCSEPISPPIATSYLRKQRNNSSNCSSTRPSKTSRTFTKKQTQETPTKRQSLKTLVINFCTIRNKVSDLAVCIGNYSPDLIIGIETHQISSVSSSELCSSTYSIISKDIDFINSKGGVLIAITNIS